MMDGGYVVRLRTPQCFLPLSYEVPDSVYSEVKCWTFLFLSQVFYFEVKYPHAWE